MLVKTKGIVIKQTKFSDSAIVVRIFTEEYGVQAFLVRGIKSKKAKTKAVMFQPLTILDMVINISDKRTLHHIKEVEIWYSYQSVTTNMIKRTLLFFIVELLYKCLKEETENRELFNWIQNSLVWLDLAEDGYVNFHLIFMMQLSMFMGFYPKQHGNNHNIVFDLQEGRFGKDIPVHPYYVTGNTALILSKLHETKFEDSVKVRLDNNTRKSILETLISYFKLHIPSMGEFKSLDVLSVILEK